MAKRNNKSTLRNVLREVILDSKMELSVRHAALATLAMYFEDVQESG